jgi:hypothetical protein
MSLNSGVTGEQGETDTMNKRPMDQRRNPPAWAAILLRASWWQIHWRNSHPHGIDFIPSIYTCPGERSGQSWWGSQGKGQHPWLHAEMHRIAEWNVYLHGTMASHRQSSVHTQLKLSLRPILTILEYALPTEGPQKERPTYRTPRAPITAQDVTNAQDWNSAGNSFGKAFNICRAAHQLWELPVMVNLDGPLVKIEKRIVE